MKKLSQMIGLRLVTIDNGLEVGIIKSVIINTKTGKIDFFATEKGVFLLKAKVIHSENIEGIGDYAITIKTKDDTKDINDVKNALELANSGVELIGSRVLTRKGRLVGEVIDLIVDENNKCKIFAFQINTNKNDTQILSVNAQDIVTLGANFIIIDESEKFLKVNNQTVMQNVSDLLDYKRKQYVMGKKCLKSIMGNDGRNLVKGNQIINEQIYEKVKKENKLFKLIKNLEK